MSAQPINTKIVSLVPNNGTEFVVNSGQKVIFDLEPSLGLVKGRDSYLVFDVCNTSSDNRRVMFNQGAGAEAIIERVDIYSKRTGQHLETMQSYGMWANITNQYFFEDKTNLQSLQGCGGKVFSKEVVGGNVVDVVNLAGNVNNGILSPVNNSGEAVYNFRRFTFPLKAGIFRYWDEERLCNVIGLQGLRIEITLNSPAESCFVMDAERSDGDGSFNLVADGLPCEDNGGIVSTITTSHAYKVDQCGFSVGNKVRITNNGGDHDKTITAIAPNGGDATKLDITFDTQLAAATTNVIKFNPTLDTRALKLRPEFRVVTIAPTPELLSSMSNGFNYEFTSFDHFIDNIPNNARKHLIELNSVASRAVCVTTMFSDVTLTGGQRNSSFYNGQTPADLNLNEVVYFLKGRLVPVRPYNPQINNEKIVSINELMKALSSLNKEPKDLGNSDGKNAEKYTNTYMIGRQLARQPYYYDLGNAEGQIRLGFSAGRTNDTLATTFIWSRKIVSVTADGGVQVVL